jgi:ABC-type protease/lipase transport system fused ATPase/permease subunit
MKNLTAAVLFSTLLFTTQVMAGAGHDHGHSHDQQTITSEEAVSRASEMVNKLAKAGKIDTTWASVASNNVEQKTFSHDPEWVVTFKNTKVSDVAKQSLYVFFSIDGQYIATNYTGK